MEKQKELTDNQNQLALFIRFLPLDLSFPLGLSIDVIKHIYLVPLHFKVVFYLYCIYYFDLLIFCCQNVATDYFPFALFFASFPILFMVSI